MEEKVIDFDYIEQRLKRNYHLFAFFTLGLLAAIEVSYFRMEYNTVFYLFLGFLVFSDFVPNYIIFKKIKCPYCEKKYFFPKVCGREKLKKLIKSDPSCINCNQKAKIISKYFDIY